MLEVIVDEVIDGVASYFSNGAIAESTGLTDKRLRPCARGFVPRPCGRQLDAVLPTVGVALRPDPSRSAVAVCRAVIPVVGFTR